MTFRGFNGKNYILVKVDGSFDENDFVEVAAITNFDENNFNENVLAEINYYGIDPDLHKMDDVDS
ncbi:unnamed protein product [Cunninghamella echinulata]